MQHYNKSVFDNGLKVVTAQMPGMQSVSLGIWIRVGGRYETKENKGISHYLEHLLFKGSKKFSCRKIKESIEGVGGALNGFTSEELTCYLAKMPADYTELALDILADMVLNPLLAEKDIVKERGVILEEIKMYKDLPQSFVHELLDELLWPDQPLGLSIAGTPESVSAMGKTQIESFCRKYYTSSNIVVSAAGLLKHDKIIQRLKHIFSSKKSGAKNVFQGVVQQQPSAQLKLLDKDTEQTHLALGFHSFNREHPLKYAQTLLHVILGANMSSRLFNEVREKRGLAYEIGTQIKRFDDTGAFVVHAGIDNTKALPMIKVVFQELSKIREDLVSADEFKRAKEFFLGQFRLALEETMDHMLWMGESVSALDKVYSLKEVIAGVEKTSRADIRKAARLIFIDNAINMSLIGPLKNIEQDLYKQLHIG